MYSYLLYIYILFTLNTKTFNIYIDRDDTLEPNDQPTKKRKLY